MYLKCMILADKSQGSQFLKVTAGAPGTVVVSSTPTLFALGSTLAGIATANGVTFGPDVRLLNVNLNPDVNTIFD